MDIDQSDDGQLHGDDDSDDADHWGSGRNIYYGGEEDARDDAEAVQDEADEAVKMNRDRLSAMQERDFIDDSFGSIITNRNVPSSNAGK